MKKSILLLAVLTLVFSLVACGGDSTDNADQGRLDDDDDSVPPVDDDDDDTGDDDTGDDDTGDDDTGDDDTGDDDTGDDDTVEIGTNVGDKMADFTVTLSDGSSFNLYEHEGTVILFDTAGMY